MSSITGNLGFVDAQSLSPDALTIVTNTLRRRLNCTGGHGIYIPTLVYSYCIRI